jgi:hypothetical protein
MLGPPPNSQCDTRSETKTVREAIAVRMTAARAPAAIPRAYRSWRCEQSPHLRVFCRQRVASENVGGVLFFCFQITRLA